MMLPTHQTSGRADHHARPTARGNVSATGYFSLPEFADQEAREKLLAALPQATDQARLSVTKGDATGLPSYLAHLWTTEVLDHEQEYHGFRKLNYLKYLLAPFQQGSETASEDANISSECSVLREQLECLRHVLVESNLRLVVSIAKRHASANTERFEELICVGNIALIRAVDLFDFRRGIRFSTYAYQAIERSIYGLYRSERRYQTRVTLDSEDKLQQVARDAGASDRAERDAAEAKVQAEALMKTLETRDRRIVMARLGIDRPDGGAAFHVIAQEIELSTTRTIQRFKECLKQMRATAALSASRRLGNQPKVSV